MKESTRRKRRRQAHVRQWAEVVALAADGQLGKAEIARRVGCCRQTIYNILKRSRGLPPGIAPVPMRPGPPPGSGVRVPHAKVKLVVDYRLRHPERGYHYCYHDLKRRGLSPPAPLTIGRAWRQAGLLPRRGRRERRTTRWAPPRPQCPGHLQVDVKYLPGGRYEYTAVDVYSRFTYARIAERLDADTARHFLAGLLAQLPFAVHTIQVDGGSEFKAGFAELVAGLRLTRRMNSPHSPWQNGVVERFHRTVAEQCYLGLPGGLAELSTAELSTALAAYLHFYNEERLHASLGYRPPVELLGTSAEPVYPNLPRRCPTNP